jgi:hypothetical protein
VYWKSAVLPPIDDDILGAIIDNAASSPSPLSAAILEFYGGAINRVAVHDTAYPLRDATYALHAVSMWTDPAQDDANIRWSRELWEAVQPFSPGSVYVNFLGVGDEGEDRVKAAYGPNYERLAKIKAKHDPSNLSATTRTSGRLAKSPQRLGSRADPAHVRPPESSLQRPACGSAYEPTGVTRDRRLCR